MYQYQLHQQWQQTLEGFSITNKKADDELFNARALTNMPQIHKLYGQLYQHHVNAGVHFQQLLDALVHAHKERSKVLRERDFKKLQLPLPWFTSNELAGMSLYVDRFCSALKSLPKKLPYLKELGVNVLHLMPFFESPQGESDGGYAVSDFRKVDARFGTIKDLQNVQKQMVKEDMYLMLDIVFNHTSHHHEWAQKAKEGNAAYQEFFYVFDDRTMPDAFEQSMPEIFPESAPGNFTYVPEMKKWVMTVFHKYQWDLNYTNPAVFVAMLDTVLFYANLGIDILRIDAPAFIWKQLGTTCQNLPQAHTILQLLRLCVQIAAPGMALLGEAIVAPVQIMQYFGEGNAKGEECDFAYNATQMALQWDMLATGDTRVMMASQPELLKKPFGTSWITYTRCHDDIGLGYEDAAIQQAGFNPYEHRRFLQKYYSGDWTGSPATGALFSVNPKTGDARISGTLASLCGLEKALKEDDEKAIHLSIQKILMMQAHSFFIGGLPMIFYGDEVGYTNDYSYLNEESKSYDNRWMHRPVIDWKKNDQRKKGGTVEQQIFDGTKKLLNIRKHLALVADKNNLQWLSPHNIHVAGFVRTEYGKQPLYCLFNFSDRPAHVTWYALKEKGHLPAVVFDHWSGEELSVGADHELLQMAPYQFFILEQQPK